jgi:spermidine synthase
MYKYDGFLIYQSYDDEGIIEVIEHQGVRSLHFGSSPRQSSMSLTDTSKLELSYVRAMTSWQLFKPDLKDEALLIGLGGGSLTKHLLQHFPDCRLRVIECRKSVVKVARSHFQLPLDPRLKIIIDDGGDYIQQRIESHAEHYSLLLIDAFDHENIASSIANEAFFAASQALLKKDGILVVNLWGGDDNPLYRQCSQWLRAIFKRRVLFLPIQDRGNVIGLAFNEDLPFFTLKYLRQQAIALEQHYQIEYPTFLKDLKKYNAHVFNQLIIK